MKKTIRLTESDLVRLVNRVIEEQSAQIKSLDTVKPSSQSQGSAQLRSVDTVKPSSKQSMGTISSVKTKPNPEEWFSKFPCIKNVSADRRKMVGGKIYNKTDDGKTYVLLPETGTYQEKGFGDAREQALNDYVGKIQGGGLYYCHKTYTSKGLGPVIMPPVK